MTDNAKFRVARLDEIEKRGSFIPVREHLGIHSFGINARTQGDNGVLVNEHDEAGGQEEVYIVLDGTATFEIDGQTVEAPAGTFISVEPEAKRKATGDATVLALGGTVGEAYQAMDWGDAYADHSESMKAYGEERYSDAAAAVRRALETHPDHAGLNYNYACFSALAGEVDDETFERLRKGVEGFPQFREQARGDSDFDSVRDDPRFEEALR
jgi:mannose-6-phosphate isomerase-like protein (cupin superfamily)